MSATPLSKFVTSEEVKALTQRNDLMGAWVILKCWLITAAIFAMVGIWTNPFTIVLAVILLGGRQLNLAIIMHDAGHQLLFNNAKLNTTIGNWCAAHFLFLSTQFYAKQHNHHHGFAGTEKDPDLPNFKAYPVSKASFSRKIARDVFGITAVKFILALIFNSSGLMDSDPNHHKTVLKSILVNLLFAGLMWSLGLLWMYGLWMLAFFTSYMVVLRVRQAAEHGAVPNYLDRDPRANTRTTLASWWEQLLFAPANVNYHVEHHLIPKVPCYRLPELHKILESRGYFDQFPVTKGYIPLMQELIAK